jgi:uncharacterized FlaG/YvyC family protein
MITSPVSNSKVAVAPISTSSFNVGESSQKAAPAAVNPVPVADVQEQANLHQAQAQKWVQEQPEEEITPEQKLEEAVKVIEQVLNLSTDKVKIRFNEDAGRYQISKVTQATDEVIWEFPQDKIMKIVAKIKESLAEALGFLVDEKV